MKHATCGKCGAVLTCPDGCKRPLHGHTPPEPAPLEKQNTKQLAAILQELQKLVQIGNAVRTQLITANAQLERVYKSLPVKANPAALEVEGLADLPAAQFHEDGTTCTVRHVGKTYVLRRGEWEPDEEDDGVAY